MSAALWEPPNPIWHDDASGLEVYINGALIELNMGDGWSGRLEPAEAVAAAAGLAAAVADAQTWAARWDGVARTYRPLGEQVAA